MDGNCRTNSGFSYGHSVIVVNIGVLYLVTLDRRPEKSSLGGMITEAFLELRGDLGFIYVVSG